MVGQSVPLSPTDVADSGRFGPIGGREGERCGLIGCWARQLLEVALGVDLYGKDIAWGLVEHGYGAERMFRIGVRSHESAGCLIYRWYGRDATVSTRGARRYLRRLDVALVISLCFCSNRLPCALLPVTSLIVFGDAAERLRDTSGLPSRWALSSGS